MPLSDESGNSNWKRKLVIGLCFLFLMAILWGADRSFRFVFAGLAAFFIFLAFLSRPRVQRVSEEDAAFEQLTDDLKIIFSKKNKFKKPPQASKRGDPRVILIASAFIFFVFASIVLAVTSLDQTSDDASTETFETDQQSDTGSELAEYRKALAGNTNDANALIGIGNLYLSESNFDSALYYYNRILENDPANADALYNIALVRFYQQDYDQSIRDAKKVLRTNPEYSNAMWLSGDSYYAEKQYDSAIYWFEQAYGRGARNADLTHQMAYIYDVQGRNSEAINYYKETVNYDSSRVDVYRRLGELLQGSEAEQFRALAEKYSSN
jgi:tetratricopeptide (TPR) repeat protein